MRALSIDSANQEVKELDLDIKANTVYSFFNSISIDEFGILKNHIIYSDTDAISNGKKPYFIGEQLIVGDALILGQVEQSETEATMPIADLEKLINYDVSEFITSTLELLKDSDISLYKVFELAKKEEKYQLNPEWVVYTFNIADDKTKTYFLDELKKVVDAKESAEDFMFKMAALALNAMG